MQMKNRLGSVGRGMSNKPQKTSKNTEKMPNKTWMKPASGQSAKSAMGWLS